MKFKINAFLCFYFCLTPSLFAGVMREDVPVQDYRDFAENLGKYGIGKENVSVYKTDGTLAGVLNFPIPDFGAVVSGGYATLFSPSFLASVKHNGGYQSVNFGNNAKYKTIYKLINRNEYDAQDFHLPRLNKVVTEAAPVPSVVGTELRANPERYTWYARAGAGTQYQVDADTQTLIQLAGAYSWKSGGTMTNPTFENWRLRWYNYSPDNPAIQPLDSASRGGDSGSPMLVYDNEEKIWKLAGVLTSGAGSAPYSLRSYILFIQDNFVAQVMAASSDPEITDVENNGTLYWNKEAIIQGEERWSWHGVEASTPAAATNAELDSSRDLRFNGEGGTLVLNQSVNLGAGKLQFSNNYQIKSADNQQYTWTGGGIEVDAGKSVLWQVNGLAGDALHKIGEGTLYVNAAGLNEGDLNVGDGTVVLDQQADENGLKQAFSTVTLVSGRPVVKLADAAQVATKNIRFGYRGGTLDINGNSLSFREIEHNDSGATVVNRNAGKTGTVTLYGNGFNFAGHFGEQDSGRLNLSYYASDSTYCATLSGGADISALKVKRGELVLSGEQTPHAGGALYSDDWREQIYRAETVEVQSGTTLTVSDHAVLKGEITVAEQATLDLYAHTLLSGSVELAENSLLQADISERASSVPGLFSTVTADISGKGQLIKNGTGILQVDGDITTTGVTELLAGTLALNGNVTSPVTIASETVLAGNGMLQSLKAASGSTIYPGALLTDSADYATLRLGSLTTTGMVGLSLNSAFRPGATDKLLIDGDISESEPVLVTVNSQSAWMDSDSNQNGSADNTEGVSIIQVGGQATKNSFRLAGDYVAQGAWAYGLYAFAPGKAAESEREVSGSGNEFWDYRLQNILLSESGNNEIPAPEVPADEDPVPTPDAPTDEAPAPAPEAPADEAPVPAPEAPADESPAPAPEAPADEAPAPAPEAPADEAPAPAPEAPADEAPAPAPEAPADEVPAPAPEAPADEAPAPAPDSEATDKNAAEQPAAPEEKPPLPSTPAAPVRRAVTPQVPAYISLPSALFRAEEQRTGLFKESALQSARAESAGFFLFGYRGEERYRSANGFLDYGYSYKSRYQGWMLGAKLASWRTDQQSLSLSGAWSRGDLTFKPAAADGYSQGSFDGNALNLMLAWHVDDYYLNLLSGYSWLKGNIATRPRGNVASPHARQIFGEIEAGKTLSFSAHQLRPYLGYRHQQLKVREFTDSDRASVSYQQQRRSALISGLAWNYTLPVVPGTLHLGMDVHWLHRPAGQGKVTVSEGRHRDAFRTGNGGDALAVQTEARLAVTDNISFSTRLNHQRRLQQEGANDWLLAGGLTVNF
ncbi:S6 family peptidase [Erwinia sp. 198]|uniref:S6 family peptidase n=1 Tax=Erwinia sp. 198 TaxID=2022746 RepID=UPI000F682260|nr:S6 family peptidase [Erwinia sp. 198]RRZ94584.1 autotransporter outer membrane beta-barrel domain-containing protein [Erwinia sp. 198]